METKGGEGPQPKVGVASDGRPMHYSVGAVIEDEQGRLLLMDRRFEPYGFASMAGHVDEGEDPLTALMREGLEELHTPLRDVVFIREEEVLWNRCWRADVHYWWLYQATVDSASVRIDPHEAKGWGWIEREELPKVPLEPVWAHWLKLTGYLK